MASWSSSRQRLPRIPHSARTESTLASSTRPFLASSSITDPLSLHPHARTHAHTHTHTYTHRHSLSNSVSALVLSIPVVSLSFSLSLSVLSPFNHDLVPLSLSAVFSHALLHFISLSPSLSLTSSPSSNKLVETITADVAASARTEVAPAKPLPAGAAFFFPNQDDHGCGCGGNDLRERETRRRETKR